MKRTRKPRPAPDTQPPLATEAPAAIAMGRKLLAIAAWQAALTHGPKFKGCVDLYAPTVEAIALPCDGDLPLKLMLRLALAGHPEAIRDAAHWACELAATLEAIAAAHPELLRSLAEPRADWPVMLCRHETSSKLVSAYLEKIGLGVHCAINASGAQVVKCSLRTPINDFVWRLLRRLPSALAVASDDPKLAAVDLAALPQLTKATARVWTNQALMPYLDALYPGLLGCARAGSHPEAGRRRQAGVATSNHSLAHPPSSLGSAILVSVAPQSPPPPRKLGPPLYAGLAPKLSNALPSVGFVSSPPSATTKTVYPENEYTLAPIYALQLTPDCRSAYS